ncbi:unnamed protein product [Protopolystoma xenopodis]|uniref:Uncharacterized protein n=1 Tax=Protopolystoma xenopodis TaxID=117903 RepID=A0A3S5BL43_9PLAT|nr:unnamed protein product [Protopolystoma xenopodis]
MLFLFHVLSYTFVFQVNIRPIGELAPGVLPLSAGKSGPILSCPFGASIQRPSTTPAILPPLLPPPLMPPSMLVSSGRSSSPAVASPLFARKNSSQLAVPGGTVRARPSTSLGLQLSQRRTKSEENKETGALIHMSFC